MASNFNPVEIIECDSLQDITQFHRRVEEVNSGSLLITTLQPHLIQSEMYFCSGSLTVKEVENCQFKPLLG